VRSQPIGRIKHPRAALAASYSPFRQAFFSRSGHAILNRPLPSPLRLPRFPFVRPAVLQLLGTAFLLSPILAKDAAVSAETPRKALAILVGVTKYHRLPRLQWCKNDVELVGKTLAQYCACGEIVVMTSESAQATLEPTRGNIIAVFDGALKLADKEAYDRVFIYFAGHGIRNGDKLYLAPQDCTDNSIQETGLSIASLREKLNAYRNIREKILILDTCHAGSRRGGANALSGEEFAGDLRDTKRLFTLASCGANEESLEWSGKGQGLFTHWLCEGLAGAADQRPYGNEDGRVDTEELTQFVTDKVETTSSVLGMPQHPVGFCAEGEPWKADLAFLPPKIATPARAAFLNAFLLEAAKYRNGGNYAAAIDQLNRVLAVEPNHPESLALRGFVHLDRGKSRGDTIDPDLAFIDFQAAVDDLDQAIAEGDVDSPPERLASWYSKRSDARYQLAQYEEALADACKVIESQPASAQAYRNRAKIYEALGRRAEAKRDEQKARECGEAGEPGKTTQSALPGYFRRAAGA
jgi:hypothetical protein